MPMLGTFCQTWEGFLVKKQPIREAHLCMSSNVNIPSTPTNDTNASASSYNRLYLTIEIDSTLSLQPHPTVIVGVTE